MKSDRRVEYGRQPIKLVSLANLKSHVRSYDLFANSRLQVNAIGIIFLWFGIMKFFPGVSPAEALATDTIQVLSFGFVSGNFARLSLALLESAIGLCLVLNIRSHIVLRVALIHMLCTFTPALFFPEQVFSVVPMGLTLVGQYIVKNVVIVCVLLGLLRKG